MICVLVDNRAAFSYLAQDASSSLVFFASQSSSLERIPGPGTKPRSLAGGDLRRGRAGRVPPFLALLLCRAILLRPIRPEDEPVLQDLFAHMSREDVRLRFLTPMRNAKASISRSASAYRSSCRAAARGTAAHCPYQAASHYGSAVGGASASRNRRFESAFLHR